MKNTKKVIGIISIIIFGVGILSTLISHKKTIRTSNNKRNVYKILVDVEESKLYLFENNIVIKEYSCSGGKWNTPSPIGTWKIVQKANWGEGFGRKLDGIKCTMGKIWNTWYIKFKFNWMVKFTPGVLE